MDCAALASQFQGIVYLPGSQAYTNEKTSYFAAFEDEVSPACFIQPNSAQEVAEIITYVQSSPAAKESQLAVRSGGHTAWAGSANIQNGITIDLSNLNAIDLNPQTLVVSIGVGATWGNVYEKLGDEGLAIVGGRDSKPGVGGLTLGGGLSYFSAQKGFVCDNVISFEVVLASGETVKANHEVNPDLFVALKGGSNNFGIVTSIEFQAFRQGQLWGGIVVFSDSNSTYPEIVEAYYNFLVDRNPDEHAHAIAASSWVSGMGEFPTASLFHTTPTINPPSLKPFTDVQPQLSSTLRIDSLFNFTNESSKLSTNGVRQWFFTTSFRADKQFLLDIRLLWLETIKSIEDVAGLITTIAFHPITKGVIASSIEHGENSFGLGVSDGPLVVCLLVTMHADSSSDDRVSGFALGVIAQFEQLARERGLSASYRFLNYGYKGQKILEGYGKESIERLKATSKKYDPSGFFQKSIPGGFKLSHVTC